MTYKKRLGEILVDDGLITEVQLQKALQRQLIMGGKIGTNLIELGFVGEDGFGKALSKIHNLAFAPTKSFESIPEEIIKLIPAKIAIKNRAIPLKKDDNILTVAIENPNNLAALDELKFATGCIIHIKAASEYSIHAALERYYNHVRPRRFIEIKDTKSSKPAAPDRQNKETKPAVRTEPLKSVFGIDDEWFGEEPNFRPEDEWLGGPDEPHHAIALTPRPVPSKEEEVAKKTFQETLVALADICARDEAIKVVMDYISQYADNVVFFVITPSEAKVWDVRCRTADAKKLSGLQINFVMPSIIRSVRDSGQLYYGNISGFPLDDELLEKLGRKSPLTVSILPIVVKTRMVSMIYFDNNNKDIPSNILSEINSLGDKLSMTFEILLLKKKTGAAGH